MAKMPPFEEIRDDFERGVRTAEQAIEHPFQRRHGAPETPAQQPVNLASATAAAATKENHMSLATIEEETKNFLTEGLDYLVAQGAKLRAAAPGIIATTEAVGGSTVAKLVEAAAGAILPPAYEQVAVDFVKDLIAKYGQPTAAAAVDPAATGQQPVAAPAQ